MRNTFAWVIAVSMTTAVPHSAQIIWKKKFALTSCFNTFKVWFDLRNCYAKIFKKMQQFIQTFFVEYFFLISEPYEPSYFTVHIKSWFRYQSKLSTLLILIFFWNQCFYVRQKHSWWYVFKICKFLHYLRYKSTWKLDHLTGLGKVILFQSGRYWLKIQCIIEN